MAVTFTEEIYHSVSLIKAAWTSDSDGNASGATTNAYDGVIYRLITVPGTAGDAPDDNYDITATDANSVDVLEGAGANRDTATTEYVAADSLGAVSGSKLTVSVSGAGETNKGTIYIYIL